MRVCETDRAMNYPVEGFQTSVVSGRSTRITDCSIIRTMRWRECTAQAYQEPPSPRLGHTAVLVDARASWGEELLVIYGGLNGDKQPLGDIAVLQTASEAWFHPTTANQGPPPRAFHCAAAVGSCMYVFGGHVYVKDNKAMQKFNDLWYLNTDNWEWSAVQLPQNSPQPSPRDFLDIVALPGRKLLLFGGLEVNEKRSDETWLFDCSTSTWMELDLPSPRPKARYAHALVRVDQRVLLCGGGGETATTMLNDLWILKGVAAAEDADPCWVPLEVPGPAPSPRRAHTVAAVGWKVVVFGGHASEVGWFRSKTEHYFNDVAVLDRQGSVQWRAVSTEGDLPAGREFHTLTAITPTRLLLFGGGNGKSIFSDTWWLLLEDNWQQAALQSSPPANAQGRILMDGGRRTALQEASACSEMSEVSMWPDQSLLGTADLATTRDRATTLHPEATRPASLWWSGSPAASKLDSLLRRLQVPSDPTTPEPRAAEPSTFHQLGRQLCQERHGSQPASASQLEAAAREYLSTSAAKGLRLRDLDALLWDYRRCCAADRRRAASLEAALSRLEQGECHRFSHMQAGDLRLGDVGALHAEYRAKLGTMKS